jgi:hypothetical protein
MITGALPEGFRCVSIRFQSRFNSRFFAPVTPDPRVLPELSLFDSAEQRKKKVAQHERHFRKLGARIRRDAAITGKAGRKPEPETVELYEARFVEGKSWGLCFDELWSAPGRKPPVRHERATVQRQNPRTTVSVSMAERVNSVIALAPVSARTD